MELLGLVTRPIFSSRVASSPQLQASRLLSSFRLHHILSAQLWPQKLRSDADWAQVGRVDVADTWPHDLRQTTPILGQKQFNGNEDAEVFVVRSLSFPRISLYDDFFRSFPTSLFSRFQRSKHVLRLKALLLKVIFSLFARCTPFPSQESYRLGLCHRMHYGSHTTQAHLGTSLTPPQTSASWGMSRIQWALGPRLVTKK